MNLPTVWNGRAVQYGGGGFNGTLITGLGLLPAARYDQPSPLALGFVTYGTDSGHQNQPGQPPQAFALNNEALVNFAHASYKKVRDVSMTVMRMAYAEGPTRIYFFGSSEGGREGLTMAQRYPDDFDGIFARVPVINWAGLQHAGLRAGLATMDAGWLRPPQVKLVGNAVLGACDAQDGIVDGLVADPVGCKTRFDPAVLKCATQSSGDDCLSEAQVNAVRTLHAPYRFSFPLENGISEYPGWGVSGEATASNLNAWIGFMQKEATAKYPKLKLLAPQFAGGTAERAAQISGDLMAANPDIKAIIAVASSTCPGVAQAIETAGNASRCLCRNRNVAAPSRQPSTIMATP
jgi:feruloyl esterase